MSDTPGPYSIGSDQWPGLSRVTEEAGELLQVIGKLIGAGGADVHYDGTVFRDALAEEVADLSAALTFIVETNELDDFAIGERVARKLAQYRQWHREGRAVMSA